MSGVETHDITPLKRSLGSIKGMLQPVTKAEKHLLLSLPVVHIKCLPVSLNFVLVPALEAERLPGVCRW
jgi:hypothetical protein